MDDGLPHLHFLPIAEITEASELRLKFPADGSLRQAPPPACPPVPSQPDLLQLQPQPDLGARQQEAVRQEQPSAALPQVVANQSLYRPSGQQGVSTGDLQQFHCQAGNERCSMKSGGCRQLQWERRCWRLCRLSITMATFAPNTTPKGQVVSHSSNTHSLVWRLRSQEIGVAFLPGSYLRTHVSLSLIPKEVWIC